MDGSTNKASSMSNPQGVPFIPQNPPLPKINNNAPRFTITERIIGTTAVGTTTAGVGIQAYDVHKKHQMEKKRFDIDVNEKAGKIRDDYAQGHIDQKDAVYYLKNLELTDQAIINHLKSVKKVDLDPNANYTIVDFKIVQIETSKDGKITPITTSNKEELETLNTMQGYLHEQRGVLKQYKETLSPDSELHPECNAAILTHNTAIDGVKELQLLNASNEKIDRSMTAQNANAIVEETLQAKANLQKAIEDKETNVAQHELVHVVPSGNSRSQHHQGPGKARFGSITGAFLERDPILLVDKNSTPISSDLFKNPVYVVSDKTEGFDIQNQTMGEPTPTATTQHSSNTYHASLILLGLSFFLWTGFFFLRNKRLGEDRKAFQEKDSKIGILNHIIEKFKRNELSFKEAELQLIDNFNFTKLVAQEILLKL